jgi:hypothetical protein
MIQKRDLVNTVMNFRVPYKAGGIVAISHGGLWDIEIVELKST